MMWYLELRSMYILMLQRALGNVARSSLEMPAELMAGPTITAVAFSPAGGCAAFWRLPGPRQSDSM